MTTFEEYINNPMGGSVFTQRELFRNLYKSKFDTVLLREAGNISYTCYKDGNRYIIHLKIPSEVVTKFYYDVVIEFTPTGITGINLDKYNARFYSNDPAFVYTFAHAFIENKLFFDDCKSKMSKQAVKKVAVEKNPKNQIGYVKSLYFAYLYMKRSGLFNRLRFDSESKRYTKTGLLFNIVHSDIKIADRQSKGEELNKQNRIEKRKEESKKEEMKNYKPSTNIIQPSKKIVGTKKSTRVNSVKRSKKI